MAAGVAHHRCFASGARDAGPRGDRQLPVAAAPPAAARNAAYLWTSILSWCTRIWSSFFWLPSIRTWLPRIFS